MQNQLCIFYYFICILLSCSLLLWYKVASKKSARIELGQEKNNENLVFGDFSSYLTRNSAKYPNEQYNVGQRAEKCGIMVEKF
jgi:hypothetical protein